MTEDAEQSVDLIFFRRGGVWGALVLGSICLLVEIILAKILMRGGSGTSPFGWIVMGFWGGVGAFLGFQKPARVVLLVVSAISSAFLSFLIFGVLTFDVDLGVDFSVRMIICLFCLLPAFCSFFPFYLLLTERIRWNPGSLSNILRCFVVNASIVTLCVVLVLYYLRLSPFPFFFLTPFWASVVLAWRLRQDV